MSTYKPSTSPVVLEIALSVLKHIWIFQLLYSKTIISAQHTNASSRCSPLLSMYVTCLLWGCYPSQLGTRSDDNKVINMFVSTKYLFHYMWSCCEWSPLEHNINYNTTLSIFFLKYLLQLLLRVSHL